MGSNTGLTPVVALDCEMVGVGPEGQRSALARVAVVNVEGNVLLDTFVRPKETVVDYRTKHSGVRRSDLTGPGAVELEQAQAQVAGLLKGRLLVGHGLENDLTALMLSHPRKDMRDTARYPPFMRSPAPGRKPKPRALRHLATEHLGLDIQGGEHSPVDDARAALYLYLRHRKVWEASIKNGSLWRGAQAVKDVRKAALTAAALSAAAAGPGGNGTAAVEPKAVLSGSQLRALRTGRGLQKAKRKPKRSAPDMAGATLGGQLLNGHNQAGKSGASGQGTMVLPSDEVQQLVAVAGQAATGSKRARSMMQLLTRDVRNDPMADL